MPFDGSALRLDGQPVEGPVVIDRTQPGWASQLTGVLFSSTSPLFWVDDGPEFATALARDHNQQRVELRRLLGELLADSHGQWDQLAITACPHAAYPASWKLTATTTVGFPAPVSRIADVVAVDNLTAAGLRRTIDHCETRCVDPGPTLWAVIRADPALRPGLTRLVGIESPEFYKVLDPEQGPEHPALWSVATRIDHDAEGSLYVYEQLLESVEEHIELHTSPGALTPGAPVVEVLDALAADWVGSVEDLVATAAATLA